MNPHAVHIVLMGLPGSGKSTLGKKLAQIMGLPFIDLDTAIEEMEGLAVPELFSRKGEDYFRQAEANCLRALLDNENSYVLATGGGAPCFFDNLERIQQKACSVYLQVSFEDLAQRLLAQGVAKRPLLEGVATEQELMRLLEKKFSYRLAYYQKADLHFRNSAGASLEQLLQAIKACLRS